MGRDKILALVVVIGREQRGFLRLAVCRGLSGLVFVPG